MLPSLTELRTHSTTSLRWRKLEQLFAREGRLRELGGDYTGAARSYLDIVRLGPAMARGGLVGDLTGGLGIASRGASQLAGLRAKLGPGDCRAMAKALKEQTGRFPPIAENEANERALFTRRASFGKKVSMMFYRRTAVWQNGAAAMRAQAAQCLAWLQQHTDELSARAEELEHGPARPK
jgi:hypothetical protein